MSVSISVLKKGGISNLSKFVIRNISDSPYYSKVAKREEKKRFGYNNIKKKLEDGDNLFLIIKDGDNIIGSFNGYFESGMFWADWLIIEKKYRKKGYAINFFKYLEKLSIKKGVHKIWFDSRTNNKQSISLIKKMGYKKITTIKKHWYKQDFILWHKFL